MRFVPDAARVPNRCAFFPQIGPSHAKGFIESDMLVDDFFSTYVSIEALQQIPEKVPQAGLALRSDLTLAEARVADLERENEDLRAQMVEYDKELDAIHTLRGKGYTARQKPGRKPTAATK